MNVKLKMSMFRELGTEVVFEDIYKDSYATFVYVALRSLCKSNMKLQTTIDGIYQTLSDTEPSRTDIKEIKRALQVLKDNKLIDFVKKGMTYSIEPLDLEIYTGQDKYFNIPIKYIKSIMECKSGIKLLHHYLLLCSTINVIKKIGYHNMKYFADALDIHENTICNQRQKFVELGVISFSQQRSTYENGQFINIPKLYAMPNNADLISDAQDKAIESELKIVKKAKRKANQKVVKQVEEKLKEKKFQKELEEKEMSFDEKPKQSSDSFLDTPKHSTNVFDWDSDLPFD